MIQVARSKEGWWSWNITISNDLRKFDNAHNFLEAGSRLTGYIVSL